MENTINWMLNHKGIAIAKIVNNDKNTVEIIRYSEDESDYSEMRTIAKEKGYILIVGRNTGEENRLGYFRN